MKQLLKISLVAALATPALAQDETALVAEGTPVIETRPVTTEAEFTDPADLSVLERWQADPTTIFDGAEVDLAALQWTLRPLVLFADTPNDPRFLQQFDLLMRDIDRLSERDVIVITDTDPEAMSDVRITLRPRGYMLALVGKDGRVALRKPSPWSVRELSRSIDKMPLRQQEISDRRLGGE